MSARAQGAQASPRPSSARRSTRLRADGRTVLELDVLASNDTARSVYARWGFSLVELTLAAPLEALVDRFDSPLPHSCV